MRLRLRLLSAQLLFQEEKEIPYNDFTNDDICEEKWRWNNDDELVNNDTLVIMVTIINCSAPC